MYLEAGHSSAEFVAVLQWWISCQASEVYGSLRLQQALECEGVQEITLLHLPSEPKGFEALRFSPQGHVLPLLCHLGRELLLASLHQWYFLLTWGCLCEAQSRPCSSRCHCALFPWLLWGEVSLHCSSGAEILPAPPGPGAAVADSSVFHKSSFFSAGQMENT